MSQTHQSAVQAVEEALPKTLKSVISIIPDACYENPTWKGIVYVVFDIILYGVCMYGLLATDSPFLLIPLWILASFSVSALFILGHDAGHGALFSSSKMNDTIGRILMLPSLHAYAAWDLGHNRVHHSFTIKEENDFVWHPVCHEEFKKFPWYKKLMHRIEWSAFGAGVYYIKEIWWKKMFYFTPPSKLAAEISSDKRMVIYFALFTFISCALLGTQYAGWTFGYAAWTWVKLIGIPFLMFNYIIGATVHIHHIQPDIPWHADGVWNKFKGQVEGTTNFRISKFFNIFFHNIFIHIPHHVDPRIPFYNLPAAAESIKRYYQLAVRDQPFNFRNYFYATRLCKLYDFEKNVWMNYKGQIVSVPLQVPS